MNNKRGILLKEKISVIVPVYNAEPYLQRCISSICNQTYRNLEIIFIDDGSTDRSGILLDNNATADERIHVIHQENHGESHARNVGLEIASGDWIAFVDNDDWLEPLMYEKMLHYSGNCDLDMICASWIKEFKEASVKVENEGPVSTGIFGQTELLTYIYQRDTYQGFAYMWNKLYRKELFSDIRFDESLRVGGDVLVLAQLAVRVKKAIYLNHHFYHYLQRSDSGCHTRNANKLLDWIIAYQKVIDLFNKHQISNEIMLYVKRFMAYTAERAAKAAIVTNDQTSFHQATSVMKKYQHEYELTNEMYPERIIEFRKVIDGMWTA